jgi:hypothetical protein
LHAGKFYIPVIEILNYIREAYSLPISEAPGFGNFQRIIQTQRTIGHDKNGNPTNSITVLTDAGGKIITAFPGNCKNTFTFLSGEEQTNHSDLSSE